MNLSNYAKVGFQGSTGTGKSTTAALMALGLSVTCHSKAPVLVRDSEPGWPFLKPLFDAEGVELIIVPGRDFKGMHESLKQAVKEGCCAFVVDSITHPWMELLQRFADKTGRVPFHKFNQIKPLWNEWTVDFLDAPLHAVACGRLGFDYFYEAAEDGKKELIKGDSKMKAGGGETFGYEPHLSFEMEAHQRQKDGRLVGLEYRAFVLKDRSRALNGMEFTFQDLHDYKPGDYRHVLDAIKPHIEALNRVTGVTLGKANSAELVPNGDAAFYQKQKAKTIAQEEIEGVMVALWPGQDKDSKRNKADTLQQLFGTRSWTKVGELPIERLDGGLMVLREYERQAKSTTNESADLEALLRQSIAAVAEKKAHGQPGVFADSKKPAVDDLGITDKDLPPALQEAF